MADVDTDTEVDTKVAEALTEAPSNPRDDANDDVRAALASLKTPEAPAESAPEEPAEPEAKADHPTDPLRYADGTYKKTKSEAAPETAAPEVKPPPVDNTAKASAPQPSTAASAPPVSWAADAKQAWASLPPAVQAAALKREEEVSAGFRQKSEEVRRYEGLLAPVAQAASRRGMTAEDGLKSLLAAQDFLDRDPAGAIAWLAQQSGVDLATLSANPPASQQPARPDPVFAQVSQTVSSLQERLDGFMLQQNMGVVESFANSDKAPHYKDVENQLPDIMKGLRLENPSLTGLPLLQQAYDRAIWLNPDVRAKIIAEQQAETARAQEAKLVEKSTKASKAAVSVKGSTAETRPSKKPQANGSGDVYDSVRETMAQLRAG